MKFTNKSITSASSLFGSSEKAKMDVPSFDTRLGHPLLCPLMPCHTDVSRSVIPILPSMTDIFSSSGNTDVRSTAVEKCGLVDMVNFKTSKRLKDKGLQGNRSPANSKLGVAVGEPPVSSSYHTIEIDSINECKLSMIQPNPAGTSHCWRFGLLHYSRFGAQSSQSSRACLMCVFRCIECCSPQFLSSQLSDLSKPSPSISLDTRVSRRTVRSRPTKKCIHSSSVTDMD